MKITLKKGDFSKTFEDASTSASENTIMIWYRIGEKSVVKTERISDFDEIKIEA